MTVKKDSIERLNYHWAVGSIDSAIRESVWEAVHERLAVNALGNQIHFQFDGGTSEDASLERLALAFEIAALEGIDSLSQASGGDLELRQQAQAAAFQAFEIRRVMSRPNESFDLVWHVLQLSALAYCGDRWTDLRRWYGENVDLVASVENLGADWDKRLLKDLFQCWVRLFRKRSWKDVDEIRSLVSDLRKEQAAYESDYLGEADSPREAAFRLVSLYHWARATEVLAEYVLQGSASDVLSSLDKHFDLAVQAAIASADPQHEINLRWLHAAARVMVTSSLWWSTRGATQEISELVNSLVTREHQAMFELLPPQRAALLEQGLLDQARTAIVVDMPTSGGKTLLAEFKILQALSLFKNDSGWVAYIAPTKALCSQITRRLRKDLEPIGIRVEQLSGAVEVDAFEEQLLEEKSSPFDVLVLTPEKLSLIVRNAKISRPLVLVVLDEAQNLENESRGLRIEFLLATIRRDCQHANFLLLTPFVEDGDKIARWLGQDAGKSISFGTTAWKPNERIVGLFSAVKDDSTAAAWRLNFETLTVTERALALRGNHVVGNPKPFNIARSRMIGAGGEQKQMGLQAAAMASVMSGRGGTSIAVANKIDTVWSMAREACKALPPRQSKSPEISLVQSFLRAEVAEDFELVGMLDHGVAVHHAGLSDEMRAVIEWLAESGELRVLCATSTIAQGMNFPVSSIFLASKSVPKAGGYSGDMSPREFWNLAGRAGRIGHESVGVVGLAEGKNRVGQIEFISKATGALASRLVSLLDELASRGELGNLQAVLWQPQWDDFRSYIAHLWAQKKNLDEVLAESEHLLRQTYGYTQLRSDPKQKEKADALLKAAHFYARELSVQPGIPELADSTGFSPEGVRRAIVELGSLNSKVVALDWAPESLFGRAGKMAELFGVMLKVPQLSESLKEVGGHGLSSTNLAEITKAWVNGVGIKNIAKQYFSDGAEPTTSSVTMACKAIYRSIINSGTWGISALSRVADIDYENLSEGDRRRINAIPAMIYHGVRTEEAVLMRMNCAPRSAAEKLGAMFSEECGQNAALTVGAARDYLRSLDASEWGRALPERSPMNAEGLRSIWRVLAGEV